jgi:F-type H+-transporting ATPase subunit b|tara:strand:+ start:465 stop:950 length:486 start_codon:yes stop_codon:yes gene_type:complete
MKAHMDTLFANLTIVHSVMSARSSQRLNNSFLSRSSSRKAELPKAAKPLFAAVLSNALTALPSLAGEPGKIFDFNLTLPIIAAEFLLLMVILDKTVFGPVGKALDDRDALIRSQLEAVGDNSTEVANLIVRHCPIPGHRALISTLPFLLHALPPISEQLSY